MSALCRSWMFGNVINRKLAFQPSINSLVTARAVTIVAKKAEPKTHEDHDLRNMKYGRPQSPHLTIYAPQLTSMLSISHRITGAVLSSYMVALGVGAVVLPNDISHYISMIEGLQLSSAALFTTKFIIGFPLCYHWCNGIRHLIWDTGKFLTNKEVNKTGMAMLGLTVILTAFVASL